MRSESRDSVTEFRVSNTGRLIDMSHAEPKRWKFQRRTLGSERTRVRTSDLSLSRAREMHATRSRSLNDEATLLRNVKTTFQSRIRSFSRISSRADDFSRDNPQLHGSTGRSGMFRGTRVHIATCSLPTISRERRNPNHDSSHHRSAPFVGNVSNAAPYACCIDRLRHEE